MNARVVIAAITAALAMTLTACGGGTPNACTPDAGDRATDSAADSRTLTTVDDTKVVVPDGKPAVVFFFSYRCGACFTGGEQVVAAHHKAATKADFLLADYAPSETKKEIDAFRSQIGGTQVPAVSSGVVELASHWQVTAPSTVIVLDEDGAIAFRAVDPTAEQILEAIDQAAAA